MQILIHSVALPLSCSVCNFVPSSSSFFLAGGGGLFPNPYTVQLRLTIADFINLKKWWSLTFRPFKVPFFFFFSFFLWWIWWWWAQHWKSWLSMVLSKSVEKLSMSSIVFSFSPSYFQFNRWKKSRFFSLFGFQRFFCLCLNLKMYFFSY